MLTVWGRASSFNVQKVLWRVGELGLAHEHIPAGGTFGGLDTPGFLALKLWRGGRYGECPEPGRGGAFGKERR